MGAKNSIRVLANMSDDLTVILLKTKSSCQLIRIALQAFFFSSQGYLHWREVPVKNKQNVSLVYITDLYPDS